LGTIETAIAIDPAVISSLSLDSRISKLRRRRRNSVLKQLLMVIGPLLVGMSVLLLLAAAGVIASTR
jgi:hypothetical protein